MCWVSVGLQGLTATGAVPAGNLGIAGHAFIQSPRHSPGGVAGRSAVLLGIVMAVSRRIQNIAKYPDPRHDARLGISSLV